MSATRVDGKRVVRTKTSTWKFPFCMRCGEHDREWPNVSAFAVLVLTLLTCGVYLYFYVARRHRALAMCTVACAPPGQAVAYLGWHGTVHQFDVASEIFAREFMTANARKVVDADARAREVMNKPASVPIARPLMSQAVPPFANVLSARAAASMPPANVPPANVPPARVPFASAQQRSSGTRAVEQHRPPPPAIRPPRPAAAPPSIADGFYGAYDTVTVAGRALQGPLAYVMRDKRTADASTIITSLRVTGPRGAEPLPFWPTYAEASPAQRAVYLDWHASGRCDPEIAIGYVFIHFYGLERRVLIDGRDHEIVLAELTRLLAIYRSNRSFRGYASSLMAFLALPALSTLSEYAAYAHFGEIADDNPIALAGLLAWLHIHRRPLPPSGAMLVTESMEGAKRGAVVRRARTELADLFAIRYHERFGEGMRLDAAKRPEVISYHPGSPTLLSAARQIRVSVPHVLGKPSQFNPVVELWNDCVADLKKLSFTRRDDNASGRLTREAWYALPPELRVDYDHPDQEAWDEAIRAAPRVGAFCLLTAGRLAALAGIEVEERVTGARLRKAVEVAAALGYAVEPDARVAAKTVPASAELAVWRTMSADVPDAKLWRSVHNMLSLTLSVALADGELGEEEGRSVDGLIEDLFVLDDTMRKRVAALREILTRQPARATTIAKKLKETHGPGALAKIGRVLVAVAAADGVIVDKEHASLKSLYKTMGLATTELVAAITASGARLAMDAPVGVQAARPGVAGETITPPPDAKALALDAPAIAAIIAETREVALLLSEVLDSDDEEPSDKSLIAAAPSRTTNGAWSTLDARYHKVLRELLGRTAWTATEVRAIATRAKMMPGAILEVLNGWSEEHFGDYVIEEASGWRIHADVLERPTA